MKDYLKVKCVSLAEEAKIIRRLERRRLKAARRAKRAATQDYNYGVFFGLQAHRRIKVRQEARASHLAYGFLHDLPYSVMEETSWTPPDFKKIETLVLTYGEEGNNVLKDKFEAWKKEAIDYLNSDASNPLRMERHSHREELVSHKRFQVRCIK